MTNDSPDTLLLGSHSQQEDESLFADIKASDWLVARNVRCISGQDLKQGSSGSIVSIRRGPRLCGLDVLCCGFPVPR